MAMNGRNHFIGSCLIFIINDRKHLFVQINMILSNLESLMEKGTTLMTQRCGSETKMTT